MTQTEIYNYCIGLIKFIRTNNKLSIDEVYSISQEVKMWSGVLRCMGSSLVGDVIRKQKGEFKTSDSFSEIQKQLDDIYEEARKREITNI